MSYADLSRRVDGVRGAARRGPAAGPDRGCEHRGRRGGLSRCSRRSASGADGRTGERLARSPPPTTLTWWSGPGGVTERRARHGPRPPPRPGVAALHLRVNGFAQARAPLPRQPRRQRDRDRRLPRPQAGRRRRDHASAALLLRVVGREQPPGRWRCALLTEESVLDPRFWQPFRDQRATSFAGVPHTFELLDRIGFADLRPAVPALRHPGRWTARARRRTPLRRARPATRLRLLRDVRPDRGHRPDGLPATRPRPRGALRDRHPDPRRLVQAGSRRRSDRSMRPGEQVGELVYRGPNVMIGLRRSRRTTWRWGAPSTELRTGDLARLRLRRALRDRRAPEPGRQGVRAAHRPRPRGAGAGRTGSDRGWPLTAATAWSWRVCTGARPVDPAEVATLVRAGDRAARPPATSGRAARDPRLASGKTDYRALAELAGTRRAAEVPAPTGTPGTDELVALYAELLGRPDARPTDSFVVARRRLALLRRDVAPAGAKARQPSARMAHDPDRGARRGTGPAPARGRCSRPTCCCVRLPS